MFVNLEHPKSASLTFPLLSVKTFALYKLINKRYMIYLLLNLNELFFKNVDMLVHVIFIWYNSI